MLCGEVSYEASVRRNIACGEPGLCAPHTALKTTLHTCPLPFFGSRTIELTFWFSTIVRFYTVWVVALVEKNSKKSWPNQSKRRLSAEFADAILCKSGGVLRPLLWSREQSWALSRTGYLQDNRDASGSNIRLSLRTTARAAFNTESHLTVEWERAHREGQQQ